MRRRALANVVAAFWILARPARIHPRQSVAAGAATARDRAGGHRLLRSCSCDDLRRCRRDRAVVRTCRAGSSGLRRDHRLRQVAAGSSGRSAFCFSSLAALPPSLPRVSQLVLAAVMVRVGFLFVAIGVPGLFVTIVKRMIGRARPMVTGSARSLCVRPVHLARRLCEPAVRPCHHRLRGAGRVRRAVAARAHRPVDLRAADRGQPRRGHGALSERRVGRRAGRRSSAR